MEINRLEKIEVIRKRITTSTYVTSGGEQGIGRYQDTLDPQKLAEFLLDLIDKESKYCIPINSGSAG